MVSTHSASPSGPSQLGLRSGPSPSDNPVGVLFKRQGYEPQHFTVNLPLLDATTATHLEPQLLACVFVSVVLTQMLNGCHPVGEAPADQRLSREPMTNTHAPRGMGVAESSCTSATSRPSGASMALRDANTAAHLEQQLLACVFLSLMLMHVLNDCQAIGDAPADQALASEPTTNDPEAPSSCGTSATSWSPLHTEDDEERNAALALLGLENEEPTKEEIDAHYEKYAETHHPDKEGMTKEHMQRGEDAHKLLVGQLVKVIRQGPSTPGT